MLATLRRILAFWRPHRMVGLALVVAMLLRALFTVVLALSVKLIIDAATAESSTSSGAIIALLLVGFVVSALAGVATGSLAARAGAAILADVRNSLFDRLQRLSLGYHTQSETGDLLARFSTDVAGLADGVIRRPLKATKSLVSIAFYVPVMAVLEPRLTVAAAVAMPATIYIVNRLTPDADAALDSEKGRAADLLTEVTENLDSQATIRAFGLGRRSRERFTDRVEALRETSRDAEFRVQLLSVFTEYGIAFVQLVIVGLGAVLALRGSLDPGALAAFVALLTEFTWETTVIGSDVLPELRKTGAGIRRVDSLLAAEPLVSESPNPVPAPPLTGGIRFDNVSFSYRADGHRQLSEVTLDIPANTYAAIVGPSGSGKSTLLSLLLRFYDPEMGRVLFDGVDGRDIALADIRSHMGVVFQETALFNASLRDNVQLGDSELTDAALQNALIGAGLSDVMQRLPEGLDTRLGRGGHPLSGGQRQRVGIARALARNPRLLLLDEMTSALDPVTEAEVNATVEGLRAGRTVVTVTHRLRTITDADLIVVMNRGRVEETGRFSELRSAGGMFQNMWEKQQGFSISGDGRDAAVEAARLKLIPLFTDLSEAQLERLAGELRSQWFPAETNVFESGAPGDRFYVIVRGVMEVLSGDDQRVLAHLEDGDFFGEMALLEDAPRNATVRAVTPATVLSLERSQFSALLETAPGVARAIQQVAAERAEENLGAS